MFKIKHKRIVDDLNIESQSLLHVNHRRNTIRVTKIIIHSELYISIPELLMTIDYLSL